MLKNDDLTCQGQVPQLCIHDPGLSLPEQLKRVGREGKGKLRNISGNGAYACLFGSSLVQKLKWLFRAIGNY